MITKRYLASIYRQTLGRQITSRKHLYDINMLIYSVKADHLAGWNKGEHALRIILWPGWFRLSGLSGISR